MCRHFIKQQSFQAIKKLSIFDQIEKYCRSMNMKIDNDYVFIYDKAV